MICKGINYCYHLLYTTVIGKCEEYGCDLPQIKQTEMLSAYRPSLVHDDNYQQICITSGHTKLCYCTASRCNEQWIIGTVARAFSSSQVVYLMIGLAFLILSWNILFCYVSPCLKITRNSFSPLIRRRALDVIEKWSIFIATLKVIVLICLPTSSWIPAAVSCKTQAPERHIAELMFLPQIFRRGSPLSLAFIAFGFLPLLHIPTIVFCTITVINDEPSQVRQAKTLMLYGGTIFATVYYLSAYCISQAMSSFAESLHPECAVRTVYWAAALGFAYLMGALCTVTTIFLIIARLFEGNTKINKKEDEHLVYADLPKIKEPLEQISNASLSTARSAPPRSNYDTIELSPQPFVVSSDSGGILNLRNDYIADWIAVRIVSNNNELNIHPTKFLLPPGRTSATEVTIKSDPPPSSVQRQLSSRLLVQWFLLGANCPSQNVNALWTRPYCVPRDQWHFKIIRIYFDFG